MRFLLLIILAVLAMAAPLAADPPGLLPTRQSPPRLLPPGGMPPASFQRRFDSERQARVQSASLARLFLGGPVVFLLLTGLLALVSVTAASVGRAERLARFGLGAADRLEGRRFVPTLWGLAAFVVAVSLVAVLLGTKALAGLGLLIALAFLLLAAVGLGIAATSLGRGLLAGFDGAAVPDDSSALRLGLWALLLTAFLPVVGWLATGLAAASGLGALLEAWLARRG